MWQEVATFVGVFAVSALLPGPDTMLLASRALASGSRAASSLAVGLALGKLSLLSASVFGVAPAAAMLGSLFLVLKLAGAAYLFGLAAKTWLHAGDEASQEQRSLTRHRGSSWRGVGLGAALTLSNPQALLFYLTVLPAIVGGHRVGLVEYLLLCGALVLVMGAVAATYIVLGARFRTARVSSRRIVERVGAALLATCGVLVAIR